MRSSGVIAFQPALLPAWARHGPAAHAGANAIMVNASTMTETSVLEAFMSFAGIERDCASYRWQRQRVLLYRHVTMPPR